MSQAFFCYNIVTIFFARFLKLLTNYKAIKQLINKQLSNLIIKAIAIAL